MHNWGSFYRFELNDDGKVHKVEIHDKEDFAAAAFMAHQIFLSFGLLEDIDWLDVSVYGRQYGAKKI